MNKSCLRKQYREKRRLLSQERRFSAEETLIRELTPYIKEHEKVLSYSSNTEEVSTDTLNRYILEKSTLILPKVKGNILELYKVDNLESLVKSTWGIREPSNQSEKVTAKMPSLVIIPGIVFDKEGQRIGYGKGFYDKFLAEIQSSTTVLFIGFKEQLHPNPLPTEKFDIKPTRLILV